MCSSGVTNTGDTQKHQGILRLSYTRDMGKHQDMLTWTDA